LYHVSVLFIFNFFICIFASIVLIGNLFSLISVPTALYFLLPGLQT